MSELGVEAVAAVDRGSMLGDVLGQPHQLADSLWRAEAAGLPERDMPGGLLVCGMGGSAIGGDLALASLGNRARRPIRVVRDYAPEPWLGRDSLVLCASYSGDTEETLACYASARERGAQLAALTTGGALAELARTDGVPVIGAPAGMQPRAAVAYMTVGALECAASCGAAASLRGEVEEAGTLLGGLADDWGPEAADDSLAKELARFLAAGQPVLYGGGPTAAPARRWKTQLNENAELPAWFSTLPEADHNEICSFGAAGDLRAVFLSDPAHDPRLARRFEHTARAAERQGIAVRTVEARGRSGVERVMSLVLLGDLVSLYVAVLRGVDPTPVDAIESFKRGLGQ